MRINNIYGVIDIRRCSVVMRRQQKLALSCVATVEGRAANLDY